MSQMCSEDLTLQLTKPIVVQPPGSILRQSRSVQRLQHLSPIHVTEPIFVEEQPRITKAAPPLLLKALNLSRFSLIRLVQMDSGDLEEAI
jgi:hypothetical protein